MFSNGAWVTVWSHEKGNGNYYLARLSSSRKNAEGNYEQDWSDGRVRCVGTAANQIQNFKERDRVQIKSCGVTNNYDKEKKTMYTNYVIFAFEDGDGGSTTPSTPAKSAKKNSDFVNVADGLDGDGELPFV